MMPGDPDIISLFKDETSEPNTKILYHVTKKNVPDQELSRKIDPETGKTIIHRLISNPHYKPKAIPAEPEFTAAEPEFINVKFPTLKTPNDYVDPELLEREEKLKKFKEQEFREQEKATKQERAAKKIQSLWRTRKEKESDKKTAQKIEDFKRKRAAIKIQRAYLKENKIKSFKAKIGKFADQSYPKFKELICTSDYLTKTDWIYQFIETLEIKRIFGRNLKNNKIFKRNEDGSINPNEFTKEFEEKITNPSDWLDEKISQYLSEFHEAVYKTFIDKATEQIVKYKTSWADAVSIPTPKGHGSFQAEGTPLFPKIYKCSHCPDNHLILGKIFTKIWEQDPKRLEQLNLNPSFTPIDDTT